MISEPFPPLSDPIGQTNYQVVLALAYVLAFVGKSSDIKSTFVASLNHLAQRDWSNCLDRRQVWNQKRPPWFEAMHHLIYPVLGPIINILVSSMQTGSTIYQVISKIFQSNTIFQALQNNLSHFVDNGTVHILFDGNVRLFTKKLICHYNIIG